MAQRYSTERGAEIDDSDSCWTGGGTGGIWDAGVNITQSPVGCSPWLPDGVPQGVEGAGAELSVELDGLKAILALTPQERRRREGLTGTVKRIAGQQWPGAVVTTHGSFAHGTSWWGSPLDLCVEGCGTIEAGQVTAFGVLGKVKQMTVSPAKGTALIQVEGLNGVLACIRFSEGLDTVCDSLLNAVTEELRQAPAAVTVAAVVAHILRSACGDLLGSDTGGISEDVLLAMAIHACNRSGTPRDPSPKTDSGAALSAFLSRFGRGFNPGAESIMLDGTTTKKLREHTQDAMSVAYAAGGSRDGAYVNLAAKCTRVRQIVAHFASSEIALTQALGPLYTVSPLSSLVAHAPLWERAQEATKHIRQSAPTQQLIPPQKVHIADASGMWGGCAGVSATWPTAFSFSTTDWAGVDMWPDPSATLSNSMSNGISTVNTMSSECPPDKDKITQSFPSIDATPFDPSPLLTAASLTSDPASSLGAAAGILQCQISPLLPPVVLPDGVEPPEPPAFIGSPPGAAMPLSPCMTTSSSDDEEIVLGLATGRGTALPLVDAP